MLYRLACAIEPKRSDVMKKWTRPEFRNLRYGFEINLYVRTR